jgi:hypothetical protein
MKKASYSDPAGTKLGWNGLDLPPLTQQSQPHLPRKINPARPKSIKTQKSYSL